MYRVQSKSVSGMLAPVSVSVCAHMCVRMLLLCVSVLRQCQSSPCYRGGTEGCISAASHRTTVATAGRFVSSITSNTCRMNLTQAVSPVSFPRPSGGLITVVGLQLLLHLHPACMNTQRGIHPCTYTNTHTHSHCVTSSTWSFIQAGGSA